MPSKVTRTKSGKTTNISQQKNAKEQMKKESDSHKCPKCEYTATFPNKIRRHIQTVHSEAYKCDICNVSLDKYTDLRKHLKEKHKLRHVCDECGFEADRPAVLKKHIERCHTNGIKCTVLGCSQTVIKRRLKRHLADCHSIGKVTRHSEEKESLADNEAPLKVHNEDLSKNPKTEIVEPIEEVASTSEMLVKPEDYHGKGPLWCDKCGNVFQKLAYLRKHLNQVHYKKYKSEKRPKKYSCTVDDCGKSFKTIGLLQDHLNKHEDKKPYSCDHCQMSFHARARFAVHLSKYHQMSIRAYDVLQNLLPP